MSEYRYITLREEPALMDRAAEWFHSKWKVPKAAYVACMEAYLQKETEYGWYLCLQGPEIAGGLGVIENDFHNRKDLSPNVCAVYTEEAHRGRGIAGLLLHKAVADLEAKGISPLYLLTDHTGFYERYGWEFFAMVQGDGEPEPSRMYIHRGFANPEGKNPAQKESLRIAQLQPLVSPDKKENLERVREELTRLKERQVDLVCLGEMFACPYETAAFPLYAEPEGGESWQALSRLALENRMYLSAGSMPEIDEAGHIYNTAYVFDRQGRQIAKHRKVYLFDVDIRGGQYFKESDTLSPGRHASVFDTEFGPTGLCICFDFRFPALAKQMADQGARLILVPAAFNMTTGPAHWELLFRARAVDNQCFTVGTSVARDSAASYVAWGHSIIADPFGRIISEMDEKEGLRLSELRLPLAEEIRRQLPLLKAASASCLS